MPELRPILAAPADNTLSVTRSPTARRVPGTVRTGAVFGAVGLLAGIVSVLSGAALGLPGAESHLTIARRIWDGPGAGLGQAGASWLPVPHLALAPATLPAWLDERWFRDGWPGVLLGSLCLAITCAALFRILHRMGVRSLAVSWAALSVLALNPTMLYLHTTAMPDPVLLASVAASAAGLSGCLAVGRRPTGGEVAVYCGLPAAVATGSRYDGWVFAALAGILLLVLGIQRWGGLRSGVRLMLALVLPSAVVAAWWLLLNWSTSGDPLAFLGGGFPAPSQRDLLGELGVLPTEGSMVISITTYAQTVLYAVGAGLIAVTLASAAFFIFRIGWRGQGPVVYLLFFFAPYFVLLLYSGHAVIRHWETVPPGLLNFRYAVPLLLPAALVIGYSLDGVRRALMRRTGSWPATVGWVLPALVFGGVLAGGVHAMADPDRRVGILAEAQDNAQQNTDLWAAAEFLSAQYEGGGLLIDEVANPVLVRAGVPFNQLSARFTEGFGDQVSRPSQEWVLLSQGDADDQVGNAYRFNPAFQRDYRVAFRSGEVLVLQRGGDGG